MNKVVLLYKNSTVGTENLSVGWVNDKKMYNQQMVKFDRIVSCHWDTSNVAIAN